MVSVPKVKVLPVCHAPVVALGAVRSTRYCGVPAAHVTAFQLKAVGVVTVPLVIVVEWVKPVGATGGRKLLLIVTDACGEVILRPSSSKHPS